MLVEHFPVAVGVFVGVVVAVTGAFVFSLPIIRSPTGLSASRHYSTADVRRAFAVRGLRLPVATAASAGVTLAGPDPDLSVFVAKGRLGSTPRDRTAFERRVGNVFVHYGGAASGVRARITAAVAALRG